MGRLSKHLGAHKEQLEVYPENRYIGALESTQYLQYYRMYKSGGDTYRWGALFQHDLPDEQNNLAQQGQATLLQPSYAP